MEYLVGWGLLLGMILVLGIVIRLAGAPEKKPEATCGTGACCGRSSAHAHH